VHKVWWLAALLVRAGETNAKAKPHQLKMQIQIKEEGSELSLRG